MGAVLTAYRWVALAGPQGWSSVGEWTGLPLRALLDHVRPMPAVAHAARVRDERGGLPIEDGAPLRLLIENRADVHRARVLVPALGGAGPRRAGSARAAGQRRGASRPATLRVRPRSRNGTGPLSSGAGHA